MTIKRERWQVILKNIDYIDKDTANIDYIDKDTAN